MVLSIYDYVYYCIPRKMYTGILWFSHRNTASNFSRVFRDKTKSPYCNDSICDMYRVYTKYLTFKFPAVVSI